jgi:hypothetical protein
MCPEQPETSNINEMNKDASPVVSYGVSSIFVFFVKLSGPPSSFGENICQPPRPSIMASASSYHHHAHVGDNRCPVTKRLLAGFTNE